MGEELSVPRRGVLCAATVPFAVLVAPTRFELRDGAPGLRRLREAITEALASQGIPVIDPFDSFKAAGFEAVHFTHDGHWSLVGYRLAGTAAATWLRKSWAWD